MPAEEELLDDIRRRRQQGIDDLRADVLQRAACFGDVRLDTPDRREAFAELTAPFELAPYRLLVDPGRSMVHRDGNVSVSAVLVDAATSPAVGVALIERQYHLVDRVVHHEQLEVTPAYRGKAITPRVFLKSFARYDELGIQRVTVHAGLQTGRWYWSGKVGFDFINDAQQRHVERWATFVLGALRALQDLEGIERSQQWALLGTTTDPPPKASFEQLAEAAPAVSTVLLDPNGSGVVGSVPCADVEREAGVVSIERHLRLVAEGNGIAWDEQLPLGKLIMLSGPDWWGVFDLTDPVSRDAYKRGAERSIEAALRRA